MKKILALLIAAVLLFQVALSVSANHVTSDQKVPDYDIWMADSLMYGIDDSVGWYMLFRDLQDPVYKTLGADLLNDVPLVSMSATWSVFLNSEYRNQFLNEQKYIYEIILMNYLTYGASVEATNTKLLDTEFKFVNEIYDQAVDLMEEVSGDFTNTNISKTERANIIENLGTIDGISEAIGYFDDGKKAVGQLIEELAQYLALKEVKENKIAMLKASKEAADNNDYKNAVDDVIKVLEATELQYVQDRTGKYTWNSILDFAWEKLCDVNPVLEAIELGVTGLDFCFDTTESASHNLKLALLYTIDCYMSSGLADAVQTYLNDSTPTNARIFRECFEGYAQFQMFGNDYAKEWLGQYLDGGILKNIFHYFFNKENINTAQDLQNLCQSQINGRQTILKQIDTYSEIYKKKYPLAENEEKPTDTDKESNPSYDISIYDEILMEYRQAAEYKFDYNMLQSLSRVNQGAANFMGYTEGKVYYRYVDLNDDGNQELLVAIDDNKSIVDIYSSENGVPVRLIANDVSTGYRNRYYITMDNQIKNIISGGALNSSIVYYRLRSAENKLEVEKKYEYDGWESNVYTYTDENGNVTRVTHVEYDYANQETDVDFDSPWMRLSEWNKDNSEIETEDEELGNAVNVYQGIFMKDDTYINLQLYSLPEDEVIGIAYRVRKPEWDPSGYVKAEVMEIIGEIHGSYSGTEYEIWGERVNYSLRCYHKEIVLDGDSFYGANYIKIK